MLTTPTIEKLFKKYLYVQNAKPEAKQHQNEQAEKKEEEEERAPTIPNWECVVVKWQHYYDRYLHMHLDR